MSDNGISMYFRDDCIRIRTQTIHELNDPKYIHLFVREDDKKLFIQACERDRDAFRIHYAKSGEEKFYINAKMLMKYLARLVGVPYDSESIRFEGLLVSPGDTVVIDLSNYQVIPYEK